jgi:hypothetical protein
LSSDFFVAGTPTVIPFQYVFSRVTNRSSLWELSLK